MTFRTVSGDLPGRRDIILRGAGIVTTAAGAALLAPSAAAQSTGVVATPSLTEGPYFVDEKLERADIRVDPTDGSAQAGLLLLLGFNVSRMDNGALSPLTGAYVDVWHCNALGLYSDEQANGTAGKKFLRGYQVTDANGSVQFTTIYPGWYSGRTVHIHVKVRMYAGNQKSYEFTTQVFFDDSMTDTVFAQAPYNTRGARNTRNSNDGIYQTRLSDGSVAGALLTPAFKLESAQVSGAFSMALNLAATSSSSGGGTGGAPGAITGDGGGRPGGGRPGGR